jgi:glycosyltransferase involved in cell wall biosynthesis
MQSSGVVEKSLSHFDDEVPFMSLVVPCYNEEEAVQLFHEIVLKTLEVINKQIEFIFVDDGSKDNTLKILRQLAN